MLFYSIHPCYFSGYKKCSKRIQNLDWMNTTLFFVYLRLNQRPKHAILFLRRCWKQATSLMRRHSRYCSKPREMIELICLRYARWCSKTMWSQMSKWSGFLLRLYLLYVQFFSFSSNFLIRLLSSTKMSKVRSAWLISSERSFECIISEVKCSQFEFRWQRLYDKFISEFANIHDPPGNFTFFLLKQNNAIFKGAYKIFCARFNHGLRPSKSSFEALIKGTITNLIVCKLCVFSDLFLVDVN